MINRFIHDAFVYILGACGNSENAYFKGQYLYMDGIEHIEATGFYKESNTIVGKTSDGSKYLYFNAQNSTTILVSEEEKIILEKFEILKK